MKELYRECLTCDNKFDKKTTVISGDEKRCPSCESDKIVKWVEIKSDNTSNKIRKPLWKKGKYTELPQKIS